MLQQKEEGDKTFMMRLQDHQERHILLNRYTVFFTTLAMSFSVSLAKEEEEEIEATDQLWADVLAYIGEFYSAASGAITALAALVLVWAFIIIMTGSQQKAQAAKDWAWRTVIGYICFNTMGLLFRIIGRITGGFAM